MGNENEIEKIIRDICYFYYEQACKAPGMLYADLSFSNIYNSPYWSYVWHDLEGRTTEDTLLFCDGCLMLIFAMCLDTIDGSGNYLVHHGLQDICRKAVNSGQTDNPDTRKLIDSIILALDIVDGLVENDDTIFKHSAWAFQTFVPQYFLTMYDRSKEV